MQLPERKNAMTGKKKQNAKYNGRQNIIHKTKD